MVMLKKDVGSSNIASLGYDHVAHLAHVTFKSGAVYEYESVSPADFESLSLAPSVGKHFNTAFKHKYKGTLVVEKRAAPKPTVEDQPEMVRALLAICGHGETPARSLADAISLARAALRKAGVAC